MKAFISSLIGNCPLAWFFCSRGINDRINRICERVIRIFYDDKFSTFKELLEKNIFVSIHNRNLQVPATEYTPAFSNLDVTKIQINEKQI